MITPPSPPNYAITNMIIGDADPIEVMGALNIPGTFIAARIMVKRNKDDPDGNALIDITVNTIPATTGQILLDGTTGQYTVLFNLADTDTANLTPDGSRVNFEGFWEVRLSSASGAEYTPIRRARVRALPRLIDAV